MATERSADAQFRSLVNEVLKKIHLPVGFKVLLLADLIHTENIDEFIPLIYRARPAFLVLHDAMREFAERPDFSELCKGLRPLVESSIRDELAREYVRGKTFYDGRMAALRADNERISSDNESLKSQLADVPKRSIMNTRQIIYLGAFLLVIAALVVVSAFVVPQFKESTVTVNIEYNVGQIIAGILGGAGIVTAGVAYAVRSAPRQNPDDTDQ